jgi:seryl-tRNA synthetase
VTHTPCFRRESGSYGLLTKGIIRQHQFEKVELFQFTTPENSDSTLESIVTQACAILVALKLPYRILQLGQKELGFTAMKTYDIEIYLPSQKQYMEVSSCSNCGDFQARRLQAKYKQAQGTSHFLHTLNGSGLAIGRTLVAILEYYQTAHGDIVVPEVLRKYCHNQEILSSISK